MSITVCLELHCAPADKIPYSFSSYDEIVKIEKEHPEFSHMIITTRNGIAFYWLKQCAQKYGLESFALFDFASPQYTQECFKDREFGEFRIRRPSRAELGNVVKDINCLFAKLASDPAWIVCEESDFPEFQAEIEDEIIGCVTSCALVGPITFDFDISDDEFWERFFCFLDALRVIHKEIEETGNAVVLVYWES